MRYVVHKASDVQWDADGEPPCEGAERGMDPDSPVSFHAWWVEVEDLLQFADDNGGSIIVSRTHSGAPSICIYDHYVE